MTAFSPGGLRTRTTALAVAAVALTCLLAACGGGTTASPGGTTSSAAPTGSPGSPGSPGDGRGPFGQLDMQAVRSCLEAAGITLPSFSGRPSFSRDPNRTDRPTFSRDPNRTGLPGRRGQGGMFADPKVKAALEACGITVPSFTPRASPSVPTGSPSS